MYLYMPKNIDVVQTLTLVKRLVTEGGNISSQNSVYTLVEDGELYFGNTAYAVSCAENENLSMTSNIRPGTALADGEYHSISVGEHMSDASSDEVNTIAFDYLLEYSNGEVESGSLVLPVD